MSVARATIIDTDPGIDDAVAILLALASPEFAVAGITTVAGNIGLQTVTRNAGRILALAGRSGIPVAAGAVRPISRAALDVAEIHGRDGLGGVCFPDPLESAVGVNAVEWMAERLRAAPEGTTDLLALGPLTNLAQLIREDPRAAARIGTVVAMGGAVREPGNMGPRAEFNLKADPEAAALVLAAGLPLTLIPLDVTRKVRATLADTALLRASGRPAAVASAELIEAYFQTTAHQSAIAESRPLHDPCVMLFRIAPHLFTVEELRLSVDLGDGPDSGALAEDPDGAPVLVATGVDGKAALALLIERLTA